MDLQVQAATLAALLLGTARAVGFVLVAPPFAHRAIPARVKGAFVLMLSVILYPRIAETLPEVTLTVVAISAVTEVVIGAALGFLVYLLFTAVQIAGEIIDLAGGFSLQPAFDPMAMTMNSAVGKLYYLLATTLLFTSGGHLMIVRGFATSYESLPFGEGLPIDQLAPVLLKALSMMFLAALQIAGPMLAVLFLTDLALALLTRAAPALNVFAIGFPVKMLATFALLALTFPLLPAAVTGLVEDGIRAMLSLRGEG